MFCTQCGAEAPDNARFCTACGTSLSDGSPRQSTAGDFDDFFGSPASAPPAKKNDGPPWKRWAVPLGIVAGGYLFLYLAYGSIVQSGAQQVLADNGYENVRVDNAYYGLLAPFNGGHNEITLLLDMEGDDTRINVNVYGNPIWSREYYVEISGAEMMRLAMGL